MVWWSLGRCIGGGAPGTTPCTAYPSPRAHIPSSPSPSPSPVLSQAPSQPSPPAPLTPTWCPWVSRSSVHSGSASASSPKPERWPGLPGDTGNSNCGNLVRRPWGVGEMGRAAAQESERVTATQRHDTTRHDTAWHARKLQARGLLCRGTTTPALVLNLPRRQTCAPSPPWSHEERCKQNSSPPSPAPRALLLHDASAPSHKHYCLQLSPLPVLR
mgnify:CR=1 FL=1